MRSFTLSVVAALFLGAVSATPLVQSGNSVRAVGTADAANPALDLVDNLKSRDTPRGIAAIILDAQAQLDPLMDQIAFTNSQNATAEALGPIVDQVQTILASANSELQQLTGQPTSVIMASPNGHGQIDAKGLGVLITRLLYKLIAALRRLLIHLGPKIQKLLHQLVGDLLKTLDQLLYNVDCLIYGIQEYLIPAVDSLLHSLLGLKLGDLLHGLRVLHV
ncbi:hypothetical protein PILCRDRAFT_86326 [Piloderma croceum F 1598]|uniref:Uncharacterized protein n=1 Tax=Piloderma croceum (strain F 1598) TaxID=765440 RepID=A0A0C3FRR5_PILCF|nr:hypothetical protein PILCRDRAFT_86326 [Piloderma croceum F 1598]